MAAMSTELVRFGVFICDLHRKELVHKGPVAGNRLDDILEITINKTAYLGKTQQQVLWYNCDVDVLFSRLVG